MGGGGGGGGVIEKGGGGGGGGEWGLNRNGRGVFVRGALFHLEKVMVFSIRTRIQSRKGQVQEGWRSCS